MCAKCAVLFDKMDIPVLSDMSESNAWAAITAFEDWMYSNAESFSEEEYDCALHTVSSLRSEYYTRFDS